MKTVQLPLRRTYVHRNLRGHGLGGLFSRLARMVTPLVKTAVRAAKPIAKQTLKELGKQGLQVASSTLSDVLEDGVPFEEAIKRNARMGIGRARNTVTRGAKRAFEASAAGIREDIKRRKQSGGARIRKRIVTSRRHQTPHRFLQNE